MRFKLSPEKGLLVAGYVRAYPLSEKFGQQLVAWCVEQTGTLPPIVERDGEQYIGLGMPAKSWVEADKLLDTPLIVDGELV